MDRIKEKLAILSGAAKYDVSCSTSGGKRKNLTKGLGNAEGMGICHSFTEDGRCVSLLKVLMTNFCIYDCAYCVSRKSNNVKRVGFTVEEIVELTINFYRRNYIEGLFLSSGIFKNPDYTMERLVRVAKELRTKHNFHGYIHLKTIPEASEELIKEAGLYADRLSVNIELPSDASLKKIAPEKSFTGIYKPMNFISEQIKENKEDKQKFKKIPSFAGAGQSTQLIIGASPESDLQILNLSSSLYKDQALKRVYYSGYVPVSSDKRLPGISQPPTLRENRIYQADWLLRFYGFSVNEIVTERYPDLDLEIDPKLGFALRNLHLFPIDVNHADYEAILKVPGIGVRSAKMIVSARKFTMLKREHLEKIGVIMKRAKHFITFQGHSLQKDVEDAFIKAMILEKSKNKFEFRQQLSLF
ncbi:MAG TPA: putative DNA modification/repair radical SAM protein [Cytophagaceae bacterium]|jgi:putative DNA modification/repair radical SAM protein